MAVFSIFITICSKKIAKFEKKLYLFSNPKTMKINRILCLLTLLVLPLGVCAQDVKYFKYQGEVNVSYTFDMSEELNNLNLEVINGVRFSRYLFAGAGIGATADLSDEAIIFPIFVDVKGYLPVARKLDLTAGVDVGTKLDYTYDMTGGLMFRPEFGLHFPMRQKVGMKLTLLYERYSCKTTVMNAEVKYKLNQIGIKLGVSF